MSTYRLPFDLERVYGGIGFASEVLYSNFVSSIDGVVALGEGKHAGSLISGKYPADRFLMALLRACADGVLLGAGTLRSTPGHLWSPAQVYPSLAESFAGLRRSLGREPEPRLIVLTAHGDIDSAHPAIQRGATVITTDAGKRALAEKLPSTCEVVSLGKGEHVDVAKAVEEARKRGLAVLLSEGGPHLIGRLMEANLLDQAFITISPLVAGRDKQERLGMVEGVELQPLPGTWSKLLSARRHGDYMFLRYGVKR